MYSLYKKKTKKVETQQNASEFPPDADIELSLCASEIDEKENEDLTTIFLKHRVPFSKFIKDPFRVLSNPNLMVKIDDKLYDWKIACPLIVSLLAYKKVIHISENFSLHSLFQKKYFKNCLRESQQAPLHLGETGSVFQRKMIK